MSVTRDTTKDQRRFLPRKLRDRVNYSGDRINHYHGKLQYSLRREYRGMHRERGRLGVGGRDVGGCYQWRGCVDWATVGLRGCLVWCAEATDEIGSEWVARIDE